MMITDNELIGRVHRVISSRPRKQVTSADVLAVIQKESGGVPVFNPGELQYKANLHQAVLMTRLSGVTEADLLQVLTIDAGPLKGQVSKFRLEPGYWHWALNLRGSWTGAERALLGCSFGVGQKMARWLVAGVPGAQWVPFARSFAGNVDLQLQYVAGDLEQLLIASGGDRPLAYTRYNAGGSARDVSDYGRSSFGFYRAYVGSHL